MTPSFPKFKRRSMRSRPKGMSCRPALVHVNGVSQDVVDSDYFAAIIDMSDLLL
jgi:uncharacterized protein